MEADVTKVLALKESTANITVSDIFLKAVSNCLVRAPKFNATFEDGLLKQSDTVNISLAVSSPDGLLVPVIKQAEKLSIEEISKITKQVADQARAGKLDIASVEGGTFTLSNLGMWGVDSFTPIINPPQIAILGVGRIVNKPVVSEGTIQVKPLVSLCLTFDHRVVDGTEAASFLNDIKNELERISVS
jgi:pyruvate dehydrogenase E2 component (dihydrolipoamide acetyltransferase)